MHKASSLSLLTLSLFFLAAPFMNGQGKLLGGLKKAVKSVTTSVPSVKFNAADPTDKINLKTAGTPWETANYDKVALPEGVKVVLPDPLPGVKEVSMLNYNAAVSQAFQGMRLLYGDMTEKEATAFNNMWAPLYNCPSQEIIDYLNKLNPLISQFIVARQTYVDSMASYEELMLDAAEAVEWEDRDAYDEALSAAAVYARSLKVFEAAMAEIANRIIALGNPPNPIAIKAAARRQYNRIFESNKKEVYLGETWMGTKQNYDYHAEGLQPLTEPMFRYLFKANVEGVGPRYFVIQLTETGAPTKAEMEADPSALCTVKVEQVDCDNRGGKKPKFTQDGVFRTYFPKPPVMAITTLTMSLMQQFELSDVTDEDRKAGTAAYKKEYHDAAGNFGTRILRSGFFFKAAMEWSAVNKWDDSTRRRSFRTSAWWTLRRRSVRRCATISPSARRGGNCATWPPRRRPSPSLPNRSGRRKSRTRWPPTGSPSGSPSPSGRRPSPESGRVSRTHGRNGRRFSPGGTMRSRRRITRARSRN